MTHDQVAWITASEAADRLQIPYRVTLGLIQDNRLTWRLKNPTAPNRRIYLVSAESVEKFIANTTHHAHDGR